ncbi:MAG TPA: sulfurtransferase [Tahibacter sp.]|uniref:sulfurtransferase n=1 Tax=Tahibacter sp. TaxID=2056211 RepID=UPI002D0ACCDB|nr:sulfurtransferase [Tahibacter sp.]HSX61065.1 sulfurtransferase [Tahibacter sp.]
MIVNIAAYHFADVDAPQALIDRLRPRAETLALRGTVLVAPEGINLFLAGGEAQIGTFLADLRADPRFAGIAVKYSRSETAPFARLKFKLKSEIITFRRDGADPLQGRAPAVAPADLARWIAQGCDDAGRRLVLLDTRNREEVRFGSFAGALTLPIDRFTDLPAAMAGHTAALADAAVVSFCTGGIRCEKAALWLCENGLPQTLQLDGGILGYFEQVGGLGYDGHCFVFDERVALAPDLRPLVDVPVPG